MMDDTTRLDDEQNPAGDEADGYADRRGQSARQATESAASDSAFESLSAIEFSPTSRQHLEQATGHNRFWLILVAAVFLLVAATALFLFTGKSVAIVVNPAADDISVEGPYFPLDFGDRWLLHQGRYQIAITHEGYEPLSTSIDVSADADQRFEFDLVHLPGYINVNTRTETTGMVLINGQNAGGLPLANHRLEAGQYDLQIQAARYQPFSTTITVDGGGTQQAWEYDLIPDWAQVQLDSFPAAATLYIDGSPVGETPINAEVMSGVRQLELRLDGYKPWISELDVIANQPVDLQQITLIKADQMLNITSSPTAVSVRVGGEFQGQTPLQLPLAPGQQYRVDFSRAGYRSASRSVSINEDANNSVNVRLQPILGDITVSGTPGDADVYVNGVYKGALNQLLSLPSHPQRLDVRKDGFQSFSRTIVPNPNSEQRVLVNLANLDNITRQKTPNLLTLNNQYRLKLIRPSDVITLGSNRREQGRRSNEMMHQAQLQRPFYFGLTEVTNEQFMQFNPGHDSGVFEQSTLSLKNQPAVRLSWDQAARFCNWLSNRHGLPQAYEAVNSKMVPVSPMNTGFRLPTEAEWVYMSRYEAGLRATPLKYAWQGSMPPAAGSGNYSGAEAADYLSVISNYRDEHIAASMVASYPANAAGIHDLGGNVREWMHDVYAIAPGVRGSIATDPMGPVSGSSHVVRGSSWRDSGITPLRLAYRLDDVDGADDIGLRVVRYVE